MSLNDSDDSDDSTTNLKLDNKTQDLLNLGFKTITLAYEPINGSEILGLFYCDQKFFAKQTDRTLATFDIRKELYYYTLFSGTVGPKVQHVKYKASNPSASLIVMDRWTTAIYIQLRYCRYKDQYKLWIVRKLLDYIRKIHSLGLVHLDIKNENILIKSDKNVTDVCITDFGAMSLLSLSKDNKKWIRTMCDYILDIHEKLGYNFLEQNYNVTLDDLCNNPQLIDYVYLTFFYKRSKNSELKTPQR